MRKVYVLVNVLCMQYVCIAHPDPKAYERDEQKRLLIDRCLRRRQQLLGVYYTWPYCPYPKFRPVQSAVLAPADLGKTEERLRDVLSGVRQQPLPGGVGSALAYPGATAPWAHSDHGGEPASQIAGVPRKQFCVEHCQGLENSNATYSGLLSYISLTHRWVCPEAAFFRVQRPWKKIINLVKILVVFLMLPACPSIERLPDSGRHGIHETGVCGTHVQCSQYKEDKIVLHVCPNM